MLLAALRKFPKRMHVGYRWKLNRRQRELGGMGQVSADGARGEERVA